MPTIRSCTTSPRRIPRTCTGTRPICRGSNSQFATALTSMWGSQSCWRNLFASSRWPRVGAHSSCRAGAGPIMGAAQLRYVAAAHAQAVSGAGIDRGFEFGSTVYALQRRALFAASAAAMYPRVSVQAQSGWPAGTSGRSERPLPPTQPAWNAFRFGVHTRTPHSLCHTDDNGLVAATCDSRRLAPHRKAPPGALGTRGDVKFGACCFAPVPAAGSLSWAQPMPLVACFIACSLSHRKVASLTHACDCSRTDSTCDTRERARGRRS